MSRSDGRNLSEFLGAWFLVLCITTNSDYVFAILTSLRMAHVAFSFRLPPLSNSPNERTEEVSGRILGPICDHSRRTAMEERPRVANEREES